MTATPLNPAVRYLGMGHFKFYWVPTIANAAAPSRAELNAGTDLSGEISAADGWTMDRDLVDAPDLGSGYVSRLPGRRTSPDSTLTIYLTETVAEDDIRTLLSDSGSGDAGYIIRFDSGDVPTGLMDVFPVRVNSMAKSTDPDAPASVTVSFAITHEPTTNVAVPAAT